MSLYNQLFGENENAMPILGMVCLTRSKFQRYRDVFLNKEGTIVTVLTRLGGGNREDYQEVFDEMKKHEYYIRDYDDEGDNTYAYFEFRVPDHYKDLAKRLAPTEDRLSIVEMFEKEIAEANIPGSPAAKRQEEIAKQIFGAIESGNHFIGL